MNLKPYFQAAKSKHVCVLFLLQLTVWLTTLFTLPEAAASERQTKLLSNFRYTRQAQLPGDVDLTRQSNLAIRLDSDFYAHISDLNNDLRIVNSEGRITNFVLCRATGSIDVVRQRQLSGKIIRELTLPDGSFAIDFELGDVNTDISSVELAGLQTRENMQISIVVGDGRNWQTAIQPMLLNNISQWPEITAHVFPFAQKMHGKIVRVILHQGKYLKLEAVRVYTPEVKRQPETAILADYAITEIGRAVQGNSLAIEFQSSQMPLTQLKFHTPTDFFLAQVSVSGSNDRQNWNLIASGTIRKIGLDSVNTVDFPEHRCQYIQVKIDCDPAGKPLSDLEIKARGNVYDWLLAAQSGNRDLTIYYGGSVPGLSRGQANVVSGNTDCFYELSDRQGNKLYKTGVQDRRSWRYLAGAVLLIVAGIVMLTILRQVKNSQTILPED